ncbi:hypothetical protein AAES_01858 [Amazona aestiva]|uniref:Uncharacterized protein n=1 Tax=Amazona aestiva TaxID=12930 RepID=A0A0Q3XAV4_AMAAE|nr:hypothetical protein AAES_01858 [Amazona aestiva]
MVGGGHRTVMLDTLYLQDEAVLVHYIVWPQFLPQRQCYPVLGPWGQPCPVVLHLCGDGHDGDDEDDEEEPMNQDEVD